MVYGERRGRGKHPRLRGEDSFVHQGASFPVGNTPAYAGKTSIRRRVSFSEQKHPRLRGEDRHGGAVDEGEGRKHPRLRGEDPLSTPLETSWTETPPLTRGRLERRLSMYCALETPPLTRGRQLFFRHPCASLRNTPAYAGKTRRLPSLRSHLWKHPRLRGEDGLKAFCKRNLVETPPLTRGRPFCLSPVAAQERNTPAYAGKTETGYCLPEQCEKHPRLRGEDKGVETCPKRTRETPPLTRGRPLCDVSIPWHQGNTPAYAGKTAPLTKSRR